MILFFISFSLPIRADRYGHHHHHSHGSSTSDVVTTVAAVGIFAAATYGIYKFCEWIFSKTDEQILDEARNCYDSALAATKKGVDLIHEGFGQFPELKKDQAKAIMKIHEDFLYQSALVRLDSYAYQFGTHERSVADALHMVQERIALIRKKGMPCFIAKDLEHIAKDLGYLRFELAFCRDFLKEHASYYDIFNLEAGLMGAYEFEINSLDYHINNPPYLREALRMAVMKKAAHHKINYPYMAYVNTIEQEVKNLEHHIKHLNRQYHNRDAGARLLLRKLQSIYDLVVSEDAYRQELRDYQRELLERERIATEKAKAEAAAAQAHAAHLQANALQQQAHELHKQNQLQKEQNAILAAQGPARVNVYL